MSPTESPTLSSIKPWLPPIAPMRLMLGAILLLFLQGFCAVQWQLQQPYFNFQLQQQGEQIRLQDHARPITRIGNAVQNLPLPALSLIRDPDFFTSFRQLNDFLSQQDALFTLLNSSQQTWLSGPENTPTHFERRDKTLADLPLELWSYELFGSVALVIGIAFWAFHRGQPIPRLLAVAGVGYALMEWTMALYSTRELALATPAFRLLIGFNHLGGMLFGAGTVALLMFYPVARPRPRILLTCSVLLMLCWINEWGQWLEWPVNIFYFPSLPLFAAFVILAAQQFQHSRQHATTMRAFYWLVTIIVAGLGLAFALYIVPVLFGDSSWLSLCLANGIALLVFIGFVMGVQQDELFGIHRWWLHSWLAIGSLLVLVMMDILAALTLNHQAKWQLGFVTLVLSWLYLPLRHWIWRFCLRNNNDQHQTAPAAVKKLLDHFNPLHMSVHGAQPTTTECRSGLMLVLHIPESRQYWTFTGKKRGFELFTSKDSAFAQTILQDANSEYLQAQQLCALQQDRERLCQDLHDDVAADLLTLLHQAENESRRTQVLDTLQNLRNIIQQLQPAQPQRLQLCCQRWQEHFLRRCRAASVAPNWSENYLPAVELNSTASQHLHRILCEVVSNALRHAHPSQIDICVEYSQEVLCIVVCDNGHHSALKKWRSGNGLRNMHKRASDLNAQLHWDIIHDARAEYCRFTLQVPLSAITAHAHSFATGQYHEHHSAA